MVRADTKKLLFGTLALSLVLLSGAQAKTEAGHLDPSFGRGGRLTVKAPVPDEHEYGYVQKPRRARMAMDLLPSGGIAASNGISVFERSRDGRPLKSFGGDGRVQVTPPPGWIFELADLAVDSRGRVLVAGSFAAPPPTDVGSPWVGPRQAAVLRYLPDGTLDPEFGIGGVFSNEFGQAPPPRSDRPSVGLTGLAVAPDGDIVVTGYSAGDPTYGCIIGSQTGGDGRTFVSRLHPDGSLDLDFGAEGVVDEPQAERASPPALDPAGRIVFEGESGGFCFPRGPKQAGKLVMLLSNGGNGALLQSPLPFVSAVAFDSRGRLLVLGHPQDGSEFEGVFPNHRWQVRRFLADGEPDSRFGKGGVASPKVPADAALTGMTVDSRGRIVLAGSIGFRGSKEVSSFLLTRLSAKGHREHALGRDGWTATAFPGAEAFGLEVAVTPQGRLMVGGVLGSRIRLPISSLAFAAYTAR